MNQEYFTYAHGLTMTGARFERLFGGPARQARSAADAARDGPGAIDPGDHRRGDAEDDAAFAHRETGMRDLCLAGGVALNCVGNGRILREGPFEQIWIQPAAGDAGGALGVALSLWHRHLEQAARPAPEAVGHVATAGQAIGGSAQAPAPKYADGMSGSFLGPRFSEAEIAACDSKRAAGSPTRVEPQRRGRRKWPRLLADGKGRRPAAGPDGVRAARARRAVDHRRRALAEDAVGDEPEDQVPRVVPAVRAGGAARARRRVVRARRRQPVHAAGRRRAPDAAAAGAAGSGSRCGASRSSTCRARPCRRSRTSTIRRASRRCAARPIRCTTTSSRPFTGCTGCPVIVNTSFNVRGEPIVCTPEDAYRCFMRTDMDVLVLENFLLEKAAQPKIAPKTNRGRRSSRSTDASSSSPTNPSAMSLAAYWRAADEPHPPRGEGPLQPVAVRRRRGRSRSRWRRWRCSRWCSRGWRRCRRAARRIRCSPMRRWCRGSSSRTR